MHFRSVAVLAIGLALFPAPAARVQNDASVERVYRGAQIRLISEAGPGSGYTAWARFIGQYLGRHLPGEPGVIVQSMVGAGGLVAANYMYSVAARDGREIAALSREAPVLSLMNAPGVRYDSRPSIGSARRPAKAMSALPARMRPSAPPWICVRRNSWSAPCA
jgi:tripartite-type tricarboxylate transporter receptor subunit TctC